MRTNRPWHLGIVGFGRIGQRRHRVLRKMAGVHVPWCVDRDASSARDAGLPCLPDLRTALGQGPLDGLIIATPPAFHEAYAIAAMTAGVRHLLVEKPVACTQSAAHNMEAVATQTGASVKVGSNTRTMPEVRALVALVRAGELGPIRSAEFAIGHDGGALPAWALDPALAGGGTLLDNGVHVLDLALHMGLVTVDDPVSAVLHRCRPGIDDHAEWRVSGAAPVSFSSSWQRRDGNYLTAHIVGATGEARLTVGRQNPGLFLMRDGVETRVALDEPADSWGDDTRAFVDSLGTDRKAEATLADGVRAVTLAESIYRNATPGGQS